MDSADATRQLCNYRFLNTKNLIKANVPQIPMITASFNQIGPFETAPTIVPALIPPVIGPFHAHQSTFRGSLGRSPFRFMVCGPRGGGLTLRTLLRQQLESSSQELSRSRTRLYPMCGRRV